MVFQGLSQEQAEALWRPFLDWVANRPQDFAFEQPYRSRRFQHDIFGTPPSGAERPGSSSPTVVRVRPKETSSTAPIVAKRDNFLHGYRSAWLPASLLKKDQQRPGGCAVRRQPPLEHIAAFQQRTRRSARTFWRRPKTPR